MVRDTSAMGNPRCQARITFPFHLFFSFTSLSTWSPTRAEEVLPDIPGCMPCSCCRTREADQWRAVRRHLRNLVSRSSKTTNHRSETIGESPQGYYGSSQPVPGITSRTGATLRPLIIKDPEFPDVLLRQAGSEPAGRAGPVSSGFLVLWYYRILVWSDLVRFDTIVPLRSLFWDSGSVFISC